VSCRQRNEATSRVKGAPVEHTSDDRRIESAHHPATTHRCACSCALPCDARHSTAVVPIEMDQPTSDESPLIARMDRPSADIQQRATDTTATAHAHAYTHVTKAASSLPSCAILCRADLE
jgi:hypothetical protein